MFVCKLLNKSKLYGQEFVGKICVFRIRMKNTSAGAQII